MTTHNPFRDLPSVDRVLADGRVRDLSARYSGDTVVAFVNGTFSGIGGLTIRMKAATRNDTS